VAAAGVEEEEARSSDGRGCLRGRFQPGAFQLAQRFAVSKIKNTNKFSYVVGKHTGKQFKKINKDEHLEKLQ
jgi:hypothetical protein